MTTWEFWLRSVRPENRRVFRARGERARDAWENAWREHNGRAFGDFTFRRVEGGHQPVQPQRRPLEAKNQRSSVSSS